MTPQPSGKPIVDKNRIASLIFNQASAMGIADRARIEQITARIIERLEKPAAALPGMEAFVTPQARVSIAVTEDEIENLVKDAVEGVKSAGSAVQPSTGSGRTDVIEVPKPPIPPPPVAAAAPKTSKQEKNMPAATRNTKSEARKPKTEIRNIIPERVELSANALAVLEKRYLKKDKAGNPVEKAEDMLRRVARTVAAAELAYDPKINIRAVEDEFYGLMARLEFLPNSPTLMNAGRELGQLSACFVLPIDDAIESIFDAVKHTAMIHKSGGGTGFSFSRLRPEKDRVGSTGGVASGPVSFMRAFDVATDVIKQGGTRRGANMAILSVDHPDIERFIKAKQTAGVLTNFNLSVAVTDAFMEAVRANGEYDLINPHNGEIVEKKKARDIFDQIVNLAWKTGDPGVVFIDRINAGNPTPHLGKIESTNPCGEQPLLPYESCNLGSINLSKMTKGNGRKSIDYDRLGYTVRTAVRFLDDVIDVNKFPLPQIAERTRQTRKIGLGVMGFADMLIDLGIAYDSPEALEAAEEVMGFIQAESHKASEELAASRGTFPAYEKSVYDGQVKMRNASCTTIAPTGTLSIIAGCSSGIEPHFALCFTRNIMDGTKMVEVNPYFQRASVEGGFFSKEMMEKLAAGAHLEDFKEVPEAAKKLFVTAHNITPEGHVRMQAVFQKYTDNAVSKTVNFPADATVADVDKVYLMAFDEGLKGITIYRDGCKADQPMSTGKAEVKPEAAAPTAPAKPMGPRERAKVTTGFTEKVKTGCGNMYITINTDSTGICEVFSHLGKAGGCATAQLESTCRLASLALRSGVPIDDVAKQLKGIRCPSIAWDNGKSVLSCADAIATVLENYINSGLSVKLEGKAEANGNGNGNGHGEKKVIKDFGIVKNVAGQCVDCGSILVYQEGCFICPGCGFTKC
ncbi:vitamin B12-dependent ribonucleotide reductase [Dehalogenimonas alkenigignens]|uniref:vitamin B12-dependent ribonucleotide reductase n=1 Tax=Dehalogenimonas alkenigignens TaxID=1217799 RepID=UPI000D585806|nr:vitamin B12-dependent ribonucleotide reductase [Dehalogenimonas alkenigignens]PVV83740.1 ribonucleotide-diphosphate reductase subunit alpha [Dehalogenimonas alkenigignens]